MTREDGVLQSIVMMSSGHRGESGGGLAGRFPSFRLVERVTPQGASQCVQDVPKTYQPVWRETDKVHNLAWTVHANPVHMFDRSRVFLVQLASWRSTSFLVFGNEVFVETTRGSMEDNGQPVAEADVRAWLTALSEQRVAWLARPSAAQPAETSAGDNDDVFSSSEDDADDHPNTSDSGVVVPCARDGVPHRWQSGDFCEGTHADAADFGAAGDDSDNDQRDFSFLRRTDNEDDADAASLDNDEGDFPFTDTDTDVDD